MRVTYLLHQFPQLSETYANTEIRALLDTPDDPTEIDVISLCEADFPGESAVRPGVVADEAEIVERTRAFAPDVIHTHWLGLQLGVACRLARALDLPLTIRAHSFDVLWPRPGRRWKGWGPRRPDRSKPIEKNLDFLRSEACLGILTFPFSVPRLAAAGIPESKLLPSWPVIDYRRFHDGSPNGRGVLNGGACLPKKDFQAFLELGKRVPGREFSLYPIGYEAEALHARNRELGSPVSVREPVPHREMPRVYKRNEWLVYTADPAVGTVGWPVSVMEAQASGVGVCMPNLRPDLREYIGPGGFVYDDLGEVAEIIREPYCAKRRSEAFAHARKADASEHARRLRALWRSRGVA